jgi:phage/plasmid-associated DNA primase
VKRSDKDGFWISYSAARGGEIERNGSWYRMESDGNEISFPMLFGRCERIWKDYYSRMRGYARTAIDDAMQQAQAQGATRIPDEVKRIRERMSKLRSWLEYCQSATGMQRAEKLYQSWVTRSGMPVATTVREIDCNPMLMGCGEETLVLPSKAGERAYTRAMLKSDMITLNTGIRYVPWAELEQHDARGKTLLERHFDTVWPDKTMHSAVQARLGLIPIGGNPAKLALNAFGGRDTGKTTTGKMIAAALGKYAKNGSAHLLNNKVLNPRILHFEKARVVLISEPEGKVAAETLKMFTGNDTFDAEPKGSNEIRDDIMPMFTLLFMTNEPIQIENVDEATAGRIGVLPFQHRFIDGDDRDAHAVDNLPSEVAQAMLSWLVEGTNMYVAHGLPSHAAMDLIREQYVSGMNPYGRFVADVCEKAPAILEAAVRKHHAERKPGNRGRTEVPTYIDWNAVAPEWITDKTMLFEVFERWADANYGTGGKERMELTQYRLRQYLNGLGMQTVRDESTEERPKPNYYTGIRVVSDLKPRMRAR